jgi:hypothetical protein
MHHMAVLKKRRRTGLTAGTQASLELALVEFRVFRLASVISWFVKIVELEFGV